MEFPRRTFFDETLPSEGIESPMRKRLPRLGEVLVSKYRIERVIGEGAMGVVYAAHHELLDIHVALKVLHPDCADDETFSRFLHEAKVAARIRSEHVCGIIDVGLLEDGAPYIAMELLDGMDLADLVASRGALPIADVVDLGLQALDGLAHAHDAGVVHRDLKPNNLFLHSRGDEPPVVKLIDFGISKSDLLSGVTKIGAFIGSPSYMAPEQIIDSRSVDARTDLWSLGVVLYELLTGVLPFDGDTMPAVLSRILDETPVPLRERRPEVPPPLEALVMQCLRHDPAERPASAHQLAHALAHALATVTTLPPRTLPPPPRLVSEELADVSSITPIVMPCDEISPPPLRAPRISRAIERGSRLSFIATALGVLVLAATAAGGARKAWMYTRASQVAASSADPQEPGLGPGDPPAAGLGPGDPPAAGLGPGDPPAADIDIGIVDGGRDGGR